jgi:hypothetical protein
MTLGESCDTQTVLEGISTEVARRQNDGGWLYLIDNLR